MVIEVPPEGTSLGFGSFLKGTGSVTADFSVNAVEARLGSSGDQPAEPRLLG